LLLFVVGLMVVWVWCWCSPTNFAKSKFPAKKISINIQHRARFVALTRK
jgi:hypothetical protein